MMHEYIWRGKALLDNAAMHQGKADPRKILREIMAAKKISSERELAERAGVDQSSFNRYMRSETAWLSTRTLQALADCLAVTSSQILGEVPLSIDPRTTAVVRVMESLPDSLKDVLVATSQSLANSSGQGGRK